MPLIACLGWGSLVWKPEKLRLKTAWLTDGPQVRVEFLRKSDAKKTANGRLTLVLHRSADPVPALWAVMDYPDIVSAIEGLRIREGTAAASIASWTKGRSPKNIVGLPAWARERRIDVVIWTALGPDLPRKRTAKQVVKYLGGLTGEERQNAENYIRFAPPQIATSYRKKIETELGWTPASPA
ncbi:MAG: hypothetical protein WDO72_12020 [Pseudomonadota bacterium]